VFCVPHELNLYIRVCYAMARVLSRRGEGSMLIPVAERYKARVYVRSLTRVAGSNPSGGMDVCVVLYSKEQETKPGQSGQRSTENVERTKKNARSVHLEFSVEKVAFRQGFLQVLLFLLVSIIPPLLHTHLYQHFDLTSRTKR
jgi:hypothetical protein